MNLTSVLRSTADDRGQKCLTMMTMVVKLRRRLSRMLDNCVNIWLFRYQMVFSDPPMTQFINT